MKRIGKIITAVGIGIMFFGGMCDADGIYYYYLIAVIALGALVSLAGLAIMSVELRRAERRKACFYFIRRRDRLDADVEFIDLDKKNSTLITLASTGAIYRRNT